MIRYRRLKSACYMVNIVMAVGANISPLLFLSFRDLYGISYSLLGTLVFVNFVTQLGIDLIFSFFSHRFNIPKTVKILPFIAAGGMLIYAVWPFFFANNVYVGLVVGTVVCSLSGGLAEVLISPTVAAIPSDNPDREMSRLHSVYAWGVVFFVISFTLLLQLCGKEAWQWLTLGFIILPLIAGLLFLGTDIPNMDTPEHTTGALKLLKNKGVWLCVAAIFIGGAAECTMSQWSSGYLEQALGIPKVWGDIFGVALFALMLGLGRTMYAKHGKQIEKILLFGAVGAMLCYFVAAVSNISIIGLFACALTGLCTSMMWPGSLIVASERYPQGGVFVYALIAAGGDLGGSVGPQAVGLVTDAAIKCEAVVDIAAKCGMTAEQLGMKFGMLTGMVFPLIGIAVYAAIVRTKKKYTV